MRIYQKLFKKKIMYFILSIELNKLTSCNSSAAYEVTQKISNISGIDIDKPKFVEFVSVGIG
jgi:hypothetical protein